MKTRLALLAAVLMVVMTTVTPALASTANRRKPPPPAEQTCINQEMAALNELASLLGFKKGLKGLAKAYNLSIADIQQIVAEDCASH